MENLETKSYKKKILVSSILGLGLEGMDVMFLSFALSSIISEFNISSAAAGSISSITNIGMLLGGIIFGILADRYGRMKIFSLTIFIFALATALISIAPNMTCVYILRFITGIGAGGEYGIGMALIAEVFAKEKLARVSSWVTIGGQLGTIVAAVLGAVILPTLGWRGLFLFGLIPVILAFFVRYQLPETQAWQDLQTKDLSKKDTSLKKLFVTSQITKVTLGLTLMSTVQVAGYFGLMNWLPSIFQKKLGLSISGSSLWMISTIVGMGLGMFLFGHIVDYFGAKRAFTIFLIASACSVFLYVIATNELTLLIGGAVVGFFTNGMNAGYGALISSYYPTEIRSMANNAIFNTGRAVGGLSPVVIGFLLDKYHITAAMLFLACLYALSLLIILTMKNIPLTGKKIF